MDYRQAAQEIRDTVDMDTIVGLYGYRPKRGVMPCPFHGEKNPSLRIYPNRGGWHCFGCGRGGSVIDFVQEHEGCSFRVAVRAIDNALKLGLFDDHEDAEKAQNERRIQEWLDDFVASINAYCDAVIRTIDGRQRMRMDMVRVLEEKAWNDRQSVTADEWMMILTWSDEDQYDEYRKSRAEEFKEEVAAWRRRRRRAGSVSSRKK